MSDPQRTHPATPKRVREFRKRGEVALSRDVVSTATLAGGAIALVACVGMASGALLELTRDAALATDGRDASWLPGAASRAFASATGPTMIGAGAAALIAMLAQLGWPPAWKRPGFDLTKLSPLANLANGFGLAAIARRSGAAIAKLIVVGAIVALAIGRGLASHQLEAGGIAAVAWTTITRALWFVLGALAALAAIDWFLARRRLAARMRMTPDEVKRELRESEGDPMVKGRRKQRARELARRRIAVAVPKADVVVVNPTHYAVALRYDDATDRAPIVVAKGTDEVAARIRELARRHGVPVLSRPPLARALHKHVQEGRAVPANLYRAVAEVLAYVYRLRAGGAA